MIKSFIAAIGLVALASFPAMAQEVNYRADMKNRAENLELFLVESMPEHLSSDSEKLYLKLAKSNSKAIRLHAIQYCELKELGYSDQKIFNLFTHGFMIATKHYRFNENQKDAIRAINNRSAVYGKVYLCPGL